MRSYNAAKKHFVKNRTNSYASFTESVTQSAIAESASPLASGSHDGDEAPDVEIGDEGGTVPLPVDDSSFFQHVPQFVLFPLIVVLVAVLIVVFFKASVEEKRPIPDIITEIDQGWRPGRASFDLAVRARLLNEAGTKFTAAETTQLIRVLGNAEDSTRRAFLIEALGYGGEEQLALQELLKLAEQANEGQNVAEGERVSTIRGLGLSRSPRAVAPLVREYERVRQDNQWELRLNIVGALTNIALALPPERSEYSAIRDLLRKTLTDSKRTVAWNAAITLGNQFRDANAVFALRGVLKHWRDKLEGTDKEDRELWMPRAIDALTALKHQESYPLIKSLESDVSTRVRNAVFKYLQAVRTAAAKETSLVLPAR